jgi:hypothetical protein
VRATGPTPVFAAATKAAAAVASHPETHGSSFSSQINISFSKTLLFMHRHGTSEGDTVQKGGWSAVRNDDFGSCAVGPA